MRKFTVYVLWAVLLLSLIAVIIWRFVPLHQIAATQIKQYLQQYGIEVTKLEIEAVSANRAVLSGIEIGRTNPIKIAKLEADYTFDEIRNGRLRKLWLDGLELQTYQMDGDWVIGGLENLPEQAKNEQNSKAHVALFDTVYINSIVPGELVVTNGKLEVEGGGIAADIPFEIKATPQNWNLNSAGFDLDKKPYQAKLKNITASMNLGEDEIWRGETKLEISGISGLPVELPMLKVTAKQNISRKNLALQLAAQDTAKQHKADMAFSASLEKIATGEVRIKSTQFPWNQGSVSIENVKVGLGSKKPVTIPVRLNSVEISDLLAKVSSGKVSGNGRISGGIPVIYYPDGHINLGTGILKAINTGTLSVSPEALPGKLKEMETARLALQNFNYTTLQINVTSDAKGKPIIALATEGSNPDAFNGRAVKLNVNLQGDLLSLIQQSLLPIDDFKRLLKMGEE